MRLKVNDDYLDSDNSIIAQTFAVNEIGNIETRQGGFSNNFTIPLTTKNKLILGFPSMNSSSRNPYNKVEATLYDRGSPVAFGSLKFKTVDKNSLKCTFFSDNSEWYAAIKDKKLSELDLSEFNHAWTSANIDDSSLTTPNTSGYIYPLIDYGEYLTEATRTTTVTQMFPAIYVHSVVDRILFEAGWKLAGELKDNPTYKKMILPFANDAFVYSNSFLEGAYQFLDKNANQLMSLGGDYFVEWDTASDQVFPSEVGVYDFHFQVTLTSIGGTPVAADFYLNGVFNSTLGTLSSDGTYVFNIFGLTIAAGDYVQVKLDDSPGDVAVCTAIGSFFEVNLQSQIIAGGTVEMAQVVPRKMKQSDLIKYIFFSFGVISQANVHSKTVTANFFKSIKNNLLNAKDWSNKIDDSKTQELDYTKLLNRYKSVSVFTYKDDSNDNELQAYRAETDKTFGQGQFNLDNDHVQGISTVYTSPFSSMINIISFNEEFYIPQIRWLDSSGDKDVNPAPKVCLIETGLDVDLLSAGVVSSFEYGGNATATMPFAWFVKTIYTTETDLFLDSLAYDQVEFPNAVGEPLIFRFLEDYEDILNTPKMLKCFLNLNEVDISELDFSVPVYLSRYKAYFYISKILNFEGRQKLTEVELVKL